MNDDLYCNLVIVIGAGRSGTNMLRDILTDLPGFGTWPCDEINYIWRHGNAGYPSDEFSPDFATNQVRQYVRHQFRKFSASHHIEHIVEKTCANSLRVAFVQSIFPEARFVHIIRDGYDVCASAATRCIRNMNTGPIFPERMIDPAV